MKNTLSTCLLVNSLVFFSHAATPQKALADDRMKIGTAVMDITPPVPYRMSGYFSERLSTGIKDRLFAKAVFLEQGTTRGALVFCDLIGISPQVASRARKKIEAQCGIPFGNISIAATHSHTGPLYFGALHKHFHDRRIKNNGRDDLEEIDYPGQLVEKLVQLVLKSRKAAGEVDLRAGNVIEKRLAFNRRFYMKKGGVRFNPGQLNPDIIRAAGPVDPEACVVSLHRPGSTQPLGAIISYALHLDTVGGTEYSADYPKHMQDRLRENLGNEFTSFFGAGTCGDINHIDISIQGRRTAEEIGSLLGDTIARGMPSLEPVIQPSLAIRSDHVDAPLQQFSKQETEQAKENMKWVDTNRLSFLERVRAYKIKAVGMRKADSIPLEVHAYRPGPEVAIVTLPGEVFVEIGLAIKNASPFETTLVIELANDAPGYIPTRKAFAEGSYETVNSRVEPGQGEKMAALALRLLKELKQSLPKRKVP